MTEAFAAFVFVCKIKGEQLVCKCRDYHQQVHVTLKFSKDWPQTFAYNNCRELVFAKSTENE